MEKELLGSLELNRIYQMNCLEGMKLIPDKSISTIICDPPFGTTANKWDSVIPFDKLWEQYERIIQDDGAIVLFASQPFTTHLIMSNMKLFKYEWIWEKSNGTNFMTVKQQPFKVHENILVFSKSPASYTKKGWMKYNPQMTEGEPYKVIAGKKNHVFHSTGKNKTDGLEGYETKNEGKRYPRSVLKFNEERGMHPTQKPLSLLEFLVNTYSDENDILLDSCMGSGTLAVAVLKVGGNRKFIGFETESEYIEIANKRLDNLEGKQ